MRKGSLKSKFLWLTLLVILVPLLVTNSVAISMHNDLLRDSMRTLAYHNIQHVGLTMQIFVQTANELSTDMIGNETIRAYLLAAEAGDDPEAAARAAAVLAGFPISSQFISKATVFPITGRPINNNYYSVLTLSDEQRERALALKGHLFWVLEENARGEQTLSLIRSVRDVRNFNHQIGFIKIALNMTSLQNVLAAPDDLEQTGYTLLDEAGRIVLSTDSEKADAEELAAMALRCVDGSLWEDNQYWAACAIEKTDWVLLGRSPDQASVSFRRTLTRTLTFATLLCIVVCFAIAAIFANLVTKPLRKLGDMMATVSDGDFSQKAEVGGFSELTMLTGQFNRMNEKLDFLYNEVLRKELRVREAELSALVSQMNPHFLYNILDTLYWMAKAGRTEEVGEMVSSLSKLMRLSLSGDKEGFVSLQTELEQIRCYLSIQRIRFGDQILFELNVEDGLLDCQVLKLILQPLVENAIQHGVHPVGGGEIRVRVFSENGLLVYRVCNTGRVLRAEEIETCLHTDPVGRKGFALKNINDRLCLTYGAAYSLRYGHEDGMTYFEVVQPIVHQEGGEAFV